ncbi:MAG: site-2 protease family protein [Christensenellaceae bacterium]|nr:site-2 protease family protein [Christensenellaceae bacterium]
MIFGILSMPISARDKFILIVAFVFAAMFAIVVHEYSHAKVAVKCGDLTPKLAGRLTLNPVAHFDLFGLLMFLIIGFGWAKPVPINPDNFENKKKGTVLTSFAGVSANLFTALLCLGFLCLLNLIPESAIYASVFGEVMFTLFFYFFHYCIMVNCSLMLFNLLPIYPLDGFRVVEALAGSTNKYVQLNYRFGNLGLFIVLLLVSLIPDRYNMFSLFLGEVQKLILLILGSF